VLIESLPKPGATALFDRAELESLRQVLDAARYREYWARHRDLIAKRAQRFVPPSYIASSCGGAEDIDGMLQWLRA
jgi:hypothetical protein